MRILKSSDKGFTLIELLVVIAIIGILSSIVLASLNTARGKGADAAIKGNLEGIRVQAEMVYDTQGCYGDGTNGTPTICAASGVASAACSATADTIFAEPTVMSAILSAAKASAGSGATIAAANCVSSANQATWAISVALKSSGANALWCVDSTGASRTVTLSGTDRGFTTSPAPIIGICK